MSHLKNVQQASSAGVVLPTAGEVYQAEDGTVSQVLDDVIDADYEPTEEEILEYAEWMGMTLPDDKELLWIAREGLKTPLPKEWKPCKTDEDEIYYFNFRTGESSWHHPMDGVFRSKFETEKGRLAKTGKKSSGGGGLKSAAAVLLPPPAPTPSTPASPGIIGSSASSNLMGHINHHTTTTTNTNSLLNNAMVHSPASTGSSFGAAQPRRIVSEAEKRLEQTIRTEAERSHAAETAKADALNDAKLASSRKLHEADVAAARAADAARRDAGSSGASDDRQRRLAETRERCDAKYGAQLREAERQAEDLQTRLGKLAAERVRMDSHGGGERAAAERAAATALTQELAAADRTAAEEERRETARLQSAFAAAREAGERRVAAAAATTGTAAAAAAAAAPRAELDKELRQREVSAVMATEARRTRLEAEKTELELAIGNAEQATSPTAAAMRSPSGGSGESAQQLLQRRLAKIDAAREVKCREAQSWAARADAAAREAGAARLALLQKQLAEAKSGSSTATAAAAVVDSSSGSATSGGGVSFGQQLSALRGRFTREKVEALGQLAKEREARIADARSSAVTTPLPLGGGAGTSGPNSAVVSAFESALAGGEDSLLSSDDAAAVADRTALYADIERDWTLAMAAALEAAAALSSSSSSSGVHSGGSVEAAVAADMASFGRKLAIRRDRERRALEDRRDKMLAEHTAATALYEERRAAAAARQAEEIQDAHAVMMADAVEAAVAAERAALADRAAATRARQSTNYEAERSALCGEVDEEMEAYQLAELRRVEAEAAAAAKAIITNSNSDDTTAAAASGDKDQAVLVAEVAALRASLQARQQVHAVERRAAEEKLDGLALEQTSLRGRVSAAAAAAATGDSSVSPPAIAPPPPTVRTVLVPPPDSLPKAAHAARIAALVESYRSQEASLRAEAAAAVVVRAPVQHRTHADPSAAAAAGLGFHQPQHTYQLQLQLQQQQQQQQQQQRQYAGDLSTNDALRLWHEQRDDSRRRQDALANARGEWRGSPFPQPQHPMLLAEDPHPYPHQQQQQQEVEPRLAAAVETLNRTIGVLVGRVARLEGSTANGNGARDRNANCNRNDDGSRKRSLSRGAGAAAAAAAAAAASSSARAHPSGIPSSPSRHEGDGDGGRHSKRGRDGGGGGGGSGDRRGDDMKRKWARNMASYETNNTAAS